MTKKQNEKMTEDSNNAQNSNALITIQTGGIVGYWLQKKGSETTKAIFDGYFEQQLSEYEKAHECDDDAWRRDLKKEFVCHFHPYNEKKCMKEYEPLLERMTESDKTKAKNIVNNYLKYARSKRKELYPINHPANRIIEDTFLDAYRHGGPAYECMSWMRTEYNLPFMGSHWHNSAKTEKERLSGSWMSYHEIIIPEFVAEEYEDFDDGVLSNGQLIIEIEGNLKNCQTQEDKIRYIISLLQPFKDFADAFYPKVQIDERERSIKEHEDLIKHWEDVPEDTVDERTGRPMHPKEQIDACSKTIEKYKQDIAYWKKVQNDFYWFAQHGLGAGDYRDYPQEVNDEMCKYLSGWWRCMIQFARRLSSLVLCYGIKLMDVQERCEVYLLDHFTITDYVDQIHITSIEHARKLLDEIVGKKNVVNLTPNSPTPKLTIAAEKFKNTVNSFCFEELPLVKDLNPKQLAELIESIVKDSCYAAAMLNHLGYYELLKDKYQYSNSNIIRHCAEALGCAESTYKKYFYSMNKKSESDAYERHNAQVFLDNGKLEKDYNRIKESK